MVALQIALRYLFSKKKHSGVNIISLVSACGIAVATMAMVVVLSVFNGFTELAMSRLGMLDPQIKIVPIQGKTIADADSLAEAIAALPQIAAATPTLEERALAVIEERQMPVRLKGVDFEAYGNVSDIDATLIAGGGATDLPDGFSPAVFSVGAASQLKIYPGYDQRVDIYMPRRKGRLNPANPAASFRSAMLQPAAVFRVDQTEYDTDFMFIPLECARTLLDYTTESSAIEAAISPESTESEAIAAVRNAIGTDYDVKGRLRQQAASYKMIGVEKWITFMLLGFILIIASFNVISTLSMLIVEKEDNIATLSSIGASNGLIRRIFAIQGWLISIAGGLAGAAVGVALCLVQQWFGIVRLGGDHNAMSITVYPVKVEGSDLLVVATLVIIVGALTSMVATRIKSSR